MALKADAAFLVSSLALPSSLRIPLFLLSYWEDQNGDAVGS